MRRISFVLLLVASCYRSPYGFPAGDYWSFPLVDPLSGSRLLTEVYLCGAGPYLFALDPSAAELYTDAQLPRSDCQSVTIGDLTIDDVDSRMVSGHSFDADGRRVLGTLGWRELDALGVFGFDRERGIAWVARPPGPPHPDARVLDLDNVRLNNRRHLELRLYLGHTVSTLAPDLWSELKLTAEKRTGTFLVLEGSRRNEPRRFEFSEVGHGFLTVSGLTRETELAPVPVIPGLDGTLGIDFFKPYSVTIDRGLVYVSDRRGAIDTRVARLARWGNRVPACVARGCAALELVKSTLTIRQEWIDRNVEIVLRATKGNESLHDVELNLMKGSPSVSIPLPPEYEGAELEVIDASPVPRLCPDEKTSCVLIEGYTVD